MAVVVHKYGGSSVATPERLRAVADRVVACKRAGNDLVVVVSAMGGTTDELLTLARQVSAGEHRRELDMVLTAGERISMALLAMAIRDLGCEALSLTGSQAGIITTTDHNQARIIEVRPVRVYAALQEGRIVIVGGFAGVSTDKEVTTLGRGGSDTTAIALAAALQARTCDIFSDVDGVLTADPRVVPEARLLAELSHGEIQEMGLRGARVLAPEAIDYARRHGITLRARNAQSDAPGTVITSRPRPGVGRAVAVSADAHALPVTVTLAHADEVTVWEGLRALGLVCRDVLRVAEDGRLRLELVLDIRNTPAAAERLEACGLPGQWAVHGGEATATIVGEGLAEQASLQVRVLQSLTRLGVQPRRLWSSPWGITAILPRERLDDVVRAWHAALPGLTDTPDALPACEPTGRAEPIR